MPNTAELGELNKKVYEIGKNWDIKELQIQVNENELFLSLKGTKKKPLTVTTK